MIKRGVGTIQRRHAKNYIYEEADKRLRETVKPYQRQGLHALGVDSFEVKYYHVVRSTQVCTCTQSEVVPNHSALAQPKNLVIPNVVLDGDKEVIIDYARPLFGTPGESKVTGDEYSELDSDQDDFAIIDDEDPPRENNLFATLNTCNICYRIGFVPGYELYGYDRKVLTTYAIDSVQGYTIDSGTSPHTLRQQDPRHGYVDFILDVPKYFISVGYAIRNNQEYLSGSTLYTTNDQPLTRADIQNAAGHSLVVRCKEKTFTHVVLEFDLGTEKVRANLAQANKATDWTMFDTLGNISIVLPMTIEDVATSDVIYVPSRNTIFKVSDFTYLRTAGGKNLDWMVNVRVIQPQEALRTIHKVELLM